MKIGVNLWFLTLIIAIIKVSFTKRSEYKVSKLHLPSKQTSCAIEIGFIQHRSLFHLEQKESSSATRVISVNTYNQILHIGKLGI